MYKRQKAGGKRRRFSESKESLVRKIAEKCNALLKCDIGTSGKSDATVIGVQDTLCDTGSQAGVCGTGFAEKYGLEVDSNCTTRLTDASGNEMSVTGCTTVWLRPSMLDGKANVEGEFVDYELVVNHEMGNEIYLGRNDLARMGVIDDDFPKVRSRRIRHILSLIHI